MYTDTTEQTRKTIQRMRITALVIVVGSLLAIIGNVYVFTHL